MKTALTSDRPSFSDLRNSFSASVPFSHCNPLSPSSTSVSFPIRQKRGSPAPMSRGRLCK